MREKTTYIADDGMEFTSEIDCLEHENRSRDYDSVWFFNDCLERLSTKYKDLENLYDYTTYVWIRDKERAKEVFRFLYSEFGFIAPEEYEADQVFAWNAEWQDWYDLREHIAEQTNALAKILGKPVEEVADLG